MNSLSSKERNYMSEERFVSPYERELTDGSEVEVDFRAVEDGARKMKLVRSRLSDEKLDSLAHAIMREQKFIHPIEISQPLELGFIKLRPEAMSPVRATSKDACWDVHASVNIKVCREHVAAVPTGLRLMIPTGYRIDVRPRSGLAFKHGVTIVNSPGTIDESYAGELIIIMTKITPDPYEIKVGDRIAQISLERVIEFDVKEIYEVPKNAPDRGGGLGSSGR